MRNLHFGLQGEDVKQLQEKLESLGYADFQPTTFFGIKTHLALRKYQLDNKLPTTGIFGTTERGLMGLTTKQSKGEMFFNVAMTFVGRDATPQDRVDDDVACAETVDTIYKATFGEYMNGNITISTTKMFHFMSTSPKFELIFKPEKGAILIYPTGYGKLKNGHVFICGDNGLLYSNSSATGQFLQNYTTFTAKYRYETIGGFPRNYFRLI